MDGDRNQESGHLHGAPDDAALEASRDDALLPRGIGKACAGINHNHTAAMRTGPRREVAYVETIRCPRRHRPVGCEEGAGCTEGALLMPMIPCRPATAIS